MLQKYIVYSKSWQIWRLNKSLKLPLSQNAGLRGNEMLTNKMVPMVKMSSSNSVTVREEVFTSTPRVTVKFNFGQEKFLTLPFEIETSGSQLRGKLSSVLKIPLEDLNLSCESKSISDDQTLADFVSTSYGSIVMNLTTNYDIDVSLLFDQIYGDLPVKDVISVTVEMGKGMEPRHLSVEIVNSKMRKAFIGGYRHKLNGMEYHHASSQTVKLLKSEGMINSKSEKCCQTEPMKFSKLEGTPISVTTQTPVNGLHILEPIHRKLAAREYTSVKELEEKVLFLQRKCREWLLKTRFKSLKIEKQITIGTQYSHEMPCVSKTDPQKDYLASKQNQKLDVHARENYKSGMIKTFSNTFFLMREIKELMKLENERNEVRKRIQKKMDLKIVKKLCQPHSWRGENGYIISMETENHRKFLKWQECYTKLIDDELSNTERRQLIILMKEMLESIQDSDYLQLHELLVREIDLIDAGVKNEHLLTLQKITEKYFLAFLQDYARKCFTRLNENQPFQRKKRIYTCKNCKRMKPDSSFQKNSKGKTVSQCKSCFWIENVNRNQVDYSIYHHILRSIQREEEKCHCLYSVAFVLQVEDIYYIVNVIWQSKSILSENKNISDLRLCRFDNAIQWSPWNCFLVTHQEMIAHSSVDNPLEVYGSWLIEKIRTKHLMARLHFKHLYKRVLKPLETLSWITKKGLFNDKSMSLSSVV